MHPTSRPGLLHLPSRLQYAVTHMARDVLPGVFHLLVIFNPPSTPTLGWKAGVVFQGQHTPHLSRLSPPTFASFTQPAAPSLHQQTRTRMSTESLVAVTALISMDGGTHMRMVCSGRVVAWLVGWLVGSNHSLVSPVTELYQYSCPVVSSMYDTHDSLLFSYDASAWTPWQQHTTSNHAFQRRASVTEGSFAAILQNAADSTR